MATDRVQAIMQAVHDTLLDTGEFQSGTPYYRKNFGPAPLFMLWADGFSSGSPERSAGSDLAVTTHRIQIEFYSLMSANEQESQDRFTALVAAGVRALQANHRLNGTCIRSRVVSGQNDLWKEGSNVYLQCIMFLEADTRNW